MSKYEEFNKHVKEGHIKEVKRLLPEVDIEELPYALVWAGRIANVELVRLLLKEILERINLLKEASKELL